MERTRDVYEQTVGPFPSVGEMIHGNYNGWVGNDRLHSGTNYQMSHATWFSLNDHNYEYFYTALLREESLFKGLTLVNGRWAR